MDGVDLRIPLPTQARRRRRRRPRLSNGDAAPMHAVAPKSTNLDYSDAETVAPLHFFGRRLEAESSSDEDACCTPRNLYDSTPECSPSHAQMQEQGVQHATSFSPATIVPLGMFVMVSVGSPMLMSPVSVGSPMLLSSTPPVEVASDKSDDSHDQSQRPWHAQERHPRGSMHAKLVKKLRSRFNEGRGEAVDAYGAPVEVEDRTTLYLRFNFADATAKEVKPDGQFLRDDLMAALNDFGFFGKYDFIYLPVVFAKKEGAGYAFVNFTDPYDADHAHQVLDKWLVGRTQWTTGWSNVCQGHAANVERYRNSEVMHEDVPDLCKPVTLRDGVRQPFPGPTVPIRRPKWFRAQKGLDGCDL